MSIKKPSKRTMKEFSVAEARDILNQMPELRASLDRLEKAAQRTMDEHKRPKLTIVTD